MIPSRCSTGSPTNSLDSATSSNSQGSGSRLSNSLRNLNQQIKSSSNSLRHLTIVKPCRSKSSGDLSKMKHNNNNRPALRRSNSSTSSTMNSSTSSIKSRKNSSGSSSRKRRPGSGKGVKRGAPQRGLKRQDSLQLVAKFTGHGLENDSSTHGPDDSCSSDYGGPIKEVSNKSQSDDEMLAQYDKMLAGNSTEVPKGEIVRRLTRTSSDRGNLLRQKSFRSNSKRNVLAPDNKKDKKSVKFKVSSRSGKIKRKVQTFEKSEPDDIWWNQQEMMSFRQDCIDVVAFYQQDDDYMWALRVLYQFSQEQHNKNKPKRRHNGNTSEVESSDDEQQRLRPNDGIAEEPITEADIKKASLLFATNGLGAAARGLEMHIGQIADAFVAQHSENVVALSETGKASMNALRKESRAVSRASQEFAYAMGEFDAQEATNAHVE